MTTDYETRQQRRASDREDDKDEERKLSATDIATLERQHDRVFKQLFANFRQRRTEWDQTIDRDPARAMVILTPADGSKPVTVMSPECRKALTEHVDIITLNTAQLDAFCYDPRETAKKDIEDVRLHSAIGLDQMNEGKKLQVAIANPLMRYGVAAVMQHWKMPPAPTAEDLSATDVDPLPEGATPEQRQKHRDKQRDAYYERWHQENHCFDWEVIHMLQLGWFPVTETPKLLIQDSIIPFESLDEMEDWEGRKIGFDKDKKLIVGEGTSSSENQAADSHGFPEVHFIRRVMQHDDGSWWVTEWYVNGKGSGPDWSNGHVKKHYRCPYKTSPITLMAGGGLDTTKTDPDQRYYPRHMKPLITYTDELNGLVSLVVQMGLERAKNPNYIRLAGMTEASKTQIENILNPFGLQVTMEGAGSERAGIIKVVEVNTQEMPVLPDVQALPNNIEPAVLLRIQYLQDVAIPGCLPNRWLTGQQESSALQQGTLGLNQSQAAATPYKRDVTGTAEGIETMLQQRLEAYDYWDDGTKDGSEKVYPVRAYSDAPLRSKPPKDGQEVKLTVQKLRHPYRLQVYIDDETAQDKAATDQAVMAKYAGGWMKKTDALKEMGNADPERALEEIRLEQQFEQQLIENQPVINDQVRRLFLAMSGISIDPMQATGAMGGGGMADAQRQQANQGSSFPTPATAPAPLSTGGTSTAGAGGTF